MRPIRTQSRRPARVQLTGRDEHLLRAVGRFRACRSSDLRTLFFPCRLDTMLHRLAQLRRAGYLAATSRSRTEEHIWHVGPTGRSWLRTQGIEAGPCPRSPGLEHHLGIVSCWVALAVGAHGHPGFRLRSAVPDWERRGQPGALGAGIVPDLLLDLETPSGRHAIALEVDCGNEPLAVLRAKIRRYALVLGIAETPTFTLVMVLAGVGPGRARSIERLLAEHWAHASFIVPGGPGNVSRIVEALAAPPQPASPIVWGVSAAATRLVPTLIAADKAAP